MANKLYGIRLSSELLADVNHITKAEGFSSVQEFVRQAVRDAVKKHKLQQQLVALDKLAGSQPNIKRASNEELDAYVKKELKKKFLKLASSQPNAKIASKKELEEHVKRVFGYYD